jgi:hypothetical protein
MSYSDDARYAREEQEWSDASEAANGWSEAELLEAGIQPGERFDVEYDERGNGRPVPCKQVAEVAA